MSKNQFLKQVVIDIIAAEAKKGNEKAISALGRLAIIFEEQANGTPKIHSRFILKNLYELFELKQADTHLRSEKR